MAIHLPFFREIPVAMDYSRLTQGLSLGLRSGLSPETSLELTKDLISQPVTLERLRKASSILDSGETFSRALTESGLFGGMEGRLITISFYSGSSDETFRRLSRQYTERSIRSDLSGSLYCGAYHRDPAVSSCGAGPFIRHDAASGDPLRFCNVRW